MRSIRTHQYLFRCHYCTQVATTWDHVVPRAVSKNDDKNNLVPSCRDCNARKGDAWPTCQCDFCQWAIKMHRDKAKPPNRNVSRMRASHRYIVID